MSQTIADIVAWLRRPRAGENAYLTLWRDEIADRIEAAEKQSVTNCNRLCNAAKMREALEQIHELLSIGGNPDTAMCIRYEAAYQVAAEAISSPTRNCDRFIKANDALKAFERETGESMAIEFIKWLFAEAKGDAK